MTLIDLIGKNDFPAAMPNALVVCVLRVSMSKNTVVAAYVHE